MVEQQQHHTAMSSLDTRAQGGAVNILTALLTHLPISLTAALSPGQPGLRSLREPAKRGRLPARLRQQGQQVVRRLRRRPPQS